MDALTPEDENPQAPPTTQPLQAQPTTQPIQAQPTTQPLQAPQAGYAAPIIPASAPVNTNGPLPVVTNQQTPLLQTTLLINPDLFKLDPVVVQCPFCNTMVTTNVETSWNCLVCCWCWFFLILYIIVQVVRGKSLLCNDAKHNCPHCGRTIAQYSAC